MIIKASACSWGSGLAAHLMKEENEHVFVHDLRGFVSDNLDGAFREAKAVAQGTKCRNYLFSVSFNPPEDATCSPKDFEAAADRLETRLGLAGHPRALVVHTKEGRTHAHAVWSRIDVTTMTAPELPYYKSRCTDVSRELFQHHGWQMPKGLIDKSERDPLNFSLAEWQMAKRQGEDPRWLKSIVQACWASSDTRKGFEAALAEKSLQLAKGDKRGFVVLDYNGAVHSLPRLLGIKTKEVKAKLGDAPLRAVEEIKQKSAANLSSEAKEKIKASRERFAERQRTLKSYSVEMTHLHRDERAKLARAQSVQWIKATQERQARFPRGLRGLWSWITGENARIKDSNEAEAKAQAARQLREREELTARQNKAQAIELIRLRRELAPHTALRREAAPKQDVLAARLGLKLDR
jgi:hypothetical protein